MRASRFKENHDKLQFKKQLLNFSVKSNDMQRNDEENRHLHFVVQNKQFLV